MKFRLVFTETAKGSLKELKHDKSRKKRYKAVGKTLKFLSENPRHPSLQTHKYFSITGPGGEVIFEAYAEQNTPAAYRVFFFYGPKERSITIIAVTPHP